MGNTSSQQRNGAYQECLTPNPVNKKIYNIIEFEPHNRESVLEEREESLDSVFERFIQLGGSAWNAVSLLEGECLVDEVVCFYLNLILKQRTNVYILPYWLIHYDSFIFTLKRRYQARPKNLILVAVKASNQDWFLVGINIHLKEVNIYDSRKEISYTDELMSERVVSIVRKRLDPVIPGLNNCQIIRDEKFPKQENKVDCGVFTLVCSEYLTRQAEFNFNQSHIRDFRVQIFQQICDLKVSSLVPKSTRPEDLSMIENQLREKFMEDYYMFYKSMRSESSRNVEHTEGLDRPISHLEEVPPIGANPALDETHPELSSEDSHSLTQDGEGSYCTLQGESTEEYSMKDIAEETRLAEIGQDQPSTSSLSNIKKYSERVRILIGYKIESVFFPGKILEPIEDYGLSLSGGLLKAEPQRIHKDIRLIEIEKWRFKYRINFRTRYLQNGIEKVGWLDLVQVAQSEPRGVYIDFISRMFLFGSFYGHLINRVKKVDESGKFRIKILPFIDPKCVVPKAYFDKNREAIEEMKRRFNKKHNSKYLKKSKRGFEETPTTKRRKQFEAKLEADD